MHIYSAVCYAEVHNLVRIQAFFTYSFRLECGGFDMIAESMVHLVKNSSVIRAYV